MSLLERRLKDDDIILRVGYRVSVVSADGTDFCNDSLFVTDHDSLTYCESLYSIDSYLLGTG